jgi:hypothetical protein
MTKNALPKAHCSKAGFIEQETGWNKQAMILDAGCGTGPLLKQWMTAAAK